jgi:hypothetical protein
MHYPYQVLLLQAAAYLRPMFVHALLLSYGLMETSTMHMKSFAKCSPSAAYLQDLIMYTSLQQRPYLNFQEAHGKVCLPLLQQGNKKGVGHFVKALSWFADGRVGTEAVS